MASINAQSAEMIIESGMNDQNLMGKPHQQHYFKPTIYYDDNDIKQREDLLHSLAQNPQLMSYFYQFLEFMRARSTQQVFQLIYNGQIN